MQTSLASSLRQAKQLEDKYKMYRQTVGLETLRTIHKDAAKQWVANLKRQIVRDCDSVGGEFAEAIKRELCQGN